MEHDFINPEYNIIHDFFEITHLFVEASKLKLRYLNSNIFIEQKLSKKGVGYIGQSLDVEFVFTDTDIVHFNITARDDEPNIIGKCQIDTNDWEIYKYCISLLIYDFQTFEKYDKLITQLKDIIL